ncbi:MAG: RNA polymerase sigma factor [Crocinitomicaceae bacterium]|nr:RNA polymerase sigma factor [Crocinitomicaceae bacterium]
MKEGEVHTIIAEVISGNTHEFARLVDEYKQMVYSLCMKMAQNSEDAEEIAQDSFVKAFKGLHKFEKKSKFSTWLYQITYFTAVNHLRKRKPEIDDQYLKIEQFEDTSLPDELSKSDQKKLISEALQHLKPKERAVINLFYLEELEIKEVSQITKLSESNVKVSLLRARKKLYGIIQIILKNELNSILYES